MPLKKIKIPTKLVQNNSASNRLQFLGYTGGAVDLADYGLDAPAVYDLKTLTIANQKIPLNYNHRTKIGDTDKVQNTKQVIRGSGSITQETKIAKRVKNNLKDYEASMGLDASSATVKFYPNGFKANDQEFVGPHYLIKNTLLDEMSITEEGRDPMTKIHRLSRMELSKIKGAKPNKVRRINTSVPIKTKNKTRRINTSVPTTSDNSLKMIAKLKRLENKYPDYTNDIWEGAERGHSFRKIYNQVRLLAAEDALPTPPAVGKKSIDLLEARLVNTLCKEPEKTLEKHYGAKVRDEICGQDHIGIKEIMVTAANQTGGRFSGFSDIDTLINHVGAQNKQRIENTGFSSFSMPNLFKRAAQITMEEAWNIEEFFGPQRCYVKSHSDFKTQESYRPSGGTMWEGLDAEGRVKHGYFGKENRYLANLDTKAQMLGFNREMIENDDMGMISEMLDLMIEGALIVPDYKLMQRMLSADDDSTVNFWFSTQTTVGGTIYGQNSYSLALTEANLNTLYLAAQKQTINKGSVSWVNQISDRWAVVVTPELEKTAWEIINPARLISPTGSAVRQGVDNYWNGKLDVWKFNQLSNTSMHSSATTNRWFLWPQKRKYAPFAISYLRGRQRPIVAVKEAPVDMLGFVVVGVFDTEINNREPQAIIRSAG